MIPEERMDVYLEMTESALPEGLEALRKRAEEAGVPILRRPVRGLLKCLISYGKPKRILEIGTAVGFSAVLMAQYAPQGAKIVTIENYPPRIAQARENLKALCPEGREIRLLEGDAADILPTLEEPFDFIFLDAAKGQYLSFLPEIKRLLRPGGMLVSDNALQEGEVLESRFAVRRRDRTIHTRMREYLYAICHDEELESSILPMADGVTLSIRKSE